MRSNAGLVLILLAVLALVVSVVYFAHHPEAEALRRAEELPYVGEFVTAFRELYSPPTAPNPPAVEASQEVVHVTPTVAPLGEGQVWVLPGTELKRQPVTESKTILQFKSIANVTRLERRGDWFRVWRRGVEGWVFLEDYRDDDQPPYGRDTEPVLPQAAEPPSEEDLAEALSFMTVGDAAPGNQVPAEQRLGPYRFFTDSLDEVLIDELRAVAGAAERAYVERTGLTPVGDPAAVVLLFANEADYRRLQQSSSKLVGLAASGHAGSGLVIFYVGSRSRVEIRATLLHELVHTLNARALGPALPTWLDEGLSEALSFSRLDAGGWPDASALSGERRREGDQYILRGGKAALFRLRDRVRAATLPSVVEVSGLAWEDFVQPGDGAVHYAVAGFWIRFLLNAEDERYRDDLQAFLASIAQGEPPTAEALRQRLDESWTVLQARFELWLEFQG